MKKILFLFCIVLSFQATAQEGELPAEEIYVIKNKKNILPEVGKPQEKVTLSLKPLPKVKQKYTYKEFSLLLPLLDPKLNPPVLKTEKEESAKEGYLRLGAGNYGSTLLDAFYNSGRQKDYAYGVFLNHQASANGPVSKSGYSNNEAGAYGRYFTPNFTLGGGLAYNRGRYNFYGFDRDSSNELSSDSTKQIIQSVWFNLGLENNKKNKPVSYKAGLGIGNISDRFKASESEISLDFNGRYKIKDSSSVDVMTDLSLVKRTDSSSVNRSLWRIEPVYRFGFKGFQVHAGIQVSVANEPEVQETGAYSGSKSSFHIHPILGLQQNIFESKLIAFAGVRGGMNKRTLRSTLEANPFLAPDVYLRHENQLFNFYLGLKGQMKGQWNYRTQISIEKLNQQAFFVNSEERQEQFEVVYDSSSTRRFTWETEAIYDLGTKTRAGIRYAFIKYGLDKLNEPWHAPNSVLTIFGRQQISEKIMLSGEFYYMGGLRGFNWKTAETEKLKGLADFNLKGEYFFKKRYSAFLSVHNLLNNKNQRFLYYPTQGLRIMVGASVVF
ncbi:MAG TPA: hypothetical protein PK509_04040 [Catalimonadaceae bacterium]|nr:hypothetical protein [Catalimonadaceae bacterium]HPI11251.1 hypothetical protein [Catalimonadaceae bacterium]